MKQFLRIAFAQLFVCLTIGAFAQTITYNQPGTFQGTYYMAGGGGAFVREPCPGNRQFTMEMDRRE